MSDAILKRLYYDPSSGFVEVEKLFRRAVLEIPTITKPEVSEFIKRQKVAQLFSQTNPLHNRGKFKITGQPFHYQSDLTFFDQYKQYNSNYSIILTMVEITSKKAYAIALKNKNSESMREAFETLIKRIFKEGNTVAVLQTDNGNEFTNKSVQELLEQYSIIHRLCQADDRTI